MKYFFAAIAAFLVLTLGCNPAGRNKAPSMLVADLARWPDTYRQNFRQIENMTSKARMSIESLQMSQSFTAGFLYAAPDTMFIKAEGPFGLDLGEFFIGRNRFIIFNQFNNQFFTGPLDDPYYNRFLQTDINLNQIKHALVGHIPLPAELRLVNASNGIFSAMVGAEKWRFIVDPQNGLLRDWEIISENRLILKQEFRKYRKIKNAVIPTLIRVILPERKEMFSVFHKDIYINQRLDSNFYRIKINSKVEQLMIEE